MFDFQDISVEISMNTSHKKEAPAVVCMILSDFAFARIFCANSSLHIEYCLDVGQTLAAAAVKMDYNVASLTWSLDLKSLTNQIRKYAPSLSLSTLILIVKTHPKRLLLVELGYQSSKRNMLVKVLSKLKSDGLIKMSKKYSFFLTCILTAFKWVF